MKSIFPLALLLLLPTFVSAEDLPARKPGLWTFTITSDAPGSKPYEMKQCIDSSTDAKMMQASGAMAQKSGAKCTKKDMHKSGNKYTGGSECIFNGTKVTVDVSFSGDFSKEYSGQTDTVFDPPIMGNAKRHTDVTAKWIGACEADQVPGDMIMPNGIKVNVNSLPEQAPPQ